MYTLNMVKHNAFKAAMGQNEWDVHTLTGYETVALAQLVARDLFRSARAYLFAEIGDGNGVKAYGQSHDDGTVSWAV